MTYPRNAWGLPTNMHQYAYPKDDPPTQNPLTDQVNAVRAKLALRSSCKHVRNNTAPSMCATMAANTMSSTQYQGDPLRVLMEILKSQGHLGSQPSSPGPTLEMLSPPKTTSDECVSGVAKALTLANFKPRARLAITDGTDEASKLASEPRTETMQPLTDAAANAAPAAVTFVSQEVCAVSALAQTEEAQRGSLFFGNKMTKGTKVLHRINGKRPAASLSFKKKKTKGTKTKGKKTKGTKTKGTKTVMLRPAASPKSGRPQAPYGSAKSPPPPTLWNGAKVYTSWPKQGYRVLIRESDKVVKLFKWYGDHCAAWARVCEAIETARASGK